MSDVTDRQKGHMGAKRQVEALISAAVDEMLHSKWSPGDSETCSREANLRIAKVFMSIANRLGPDQTVGDAFSEEELLAEFVNCGVLPNGLTIEEAVETTSEVVTKKLSRRMLGEFGRERVIKFFEHALRRQ
jgi:hypothetical protein